MTTGAWCYYNNDPKNGAIYGKLYNWYAVNDSRGLAPEGFHVPSKVEWEAIVSNLGSEKYSAGKLKSTKPLWVSPNRDATNETGFTGLPGGFRGEGGANLISFFEGIKEKGFGQLLDMKKFIMISNVHHIVVLDLVMNFLLSLFGNSI